MKKAFGDRCAVRFSDNAVIIPGVAILHLHNIRDSGSMEVQGTTNQGRSIGVRVHSRIKASRSVPSRNALYIAGSLWALGS